MNLSFNVINYSCAFPAVTSDIVCCDKGLFCDVPACYLFPPAGQGAGQGHHLRIKGHQKEARGGQQAGRAHPLGEEDPRRGSLAFRCQVSPPANPPPAPTHFHFLSHMTKLFSISLGKQCSAY